MRKGDSLAAKYILANDPDADRYCLLIIGCADLCMRVRVRVCVCVCV